MEGSSTENARYKSIVEQHKEDTTPHGNISPKEEKEDLRESKAQKEEEKGEGSGRKTGLANQGATCYMNSLLQALFMTPEFRKTIYNWKYNGDIHGPQKDSIPFQLQKLFAKLELGTEPYVRTSDLICSFGWNQQESFEQNDVQEFCRVLFEAIDQSMSEEDIGSANMIKDLYEGIMLAYLRCLHCGNQSIRQEKFLDIQLCVKNLFDKIYNDTLENALDHYFNPEKLEGDNQVFCETCQEKRDTLKGYQLLKLPKILCLQLNRFTFDYELLSKIKLNEFVSFPLTLNLNYFLNKDYIGGANTEDGTLSSLILSNPLLHQLVDPTPSHPEANTGTNSTHNIEALSTERFKAIIAEEGIELQSNIQVSKAAPSKIKSEAENKKGAGIRKKHQQKMKGVRSGLRRNMINPAFFANAKESTTQTLGGVALEIDNSEYRGQGVTEAFIPGLQGVDLGTSHTHAKESKKTTKHVDNKKEESIKYESYGIENKTKEMEKLKISEISDLDKKCKDLYLQDGDYVFELFGILIHSGSAFGGHYYAYIKDYITDSWYNYNDITVRKVSISELQNAFGGQGKYLKKRQFSHSTNAYMLMYRMTDQTQSTKELMEAMEIPSYLAPIITEEQNLHQVEELERLEQRQEMQLKITYLNITKIIFCRRDHSYIDLLYVVAGEFGVNQEVQNMRLRGYNILNNVMQDTYTGREMERLSQIGIHAFQSLVLQVKKPEVEWDIWNPNIIFIKICKWRPDLTSLDENTVDPIRLNIAKDALFSTLREQIAECTNISTDVLVIAKRNPMMVSTPVEILTDNKSNLTRKIHILRINEGVRLYVEDKNTLHPGLTKFKFMLGRQLNTKWEIEFELEKNRCTFKFNTADDSNNQILDIAPEYTNIVILDRRQSVGELKSEIATLVGSSVSNIILKRGGHHGTELKDDNETIKNAHLYNMACIYLQLGTPTTILLLEEFALDTRKKISIIKEQIADKLNEFSNKKSKYKGKLLRIREKTTDKLTRVYHDEKSLDYYNVYEGKQLALQILNEEETVGEDDLLIMMRQWNPHTWELSDIYEMYVTKSMTLNDLSVFLFSVYGVQLELIECCKISSIWNFSQVQLPHEQWHKMSDNESYLAANPFFLSTDGTLLIMRDASIKEGDLRKEQKDKLAAFDYEKGGAIRAGSKSSSIKYTEKPMIIHVKKYRKEDREKEREEMKMEEGEEIGENKNPPEENKKLCTQEGDNEEQIMKP